MPLLLALSLVLPRVLTMDDALRIFRERGFDLLLADAQATLAQADERAAHAVANPQLAFTAGRSFDYDPGVCPGCSATAFSVRVTDPGALSDLITGKRGLRIDFAREAAESSDETRALVQKRFEAGAISEAELARIEVSALEAQQAVDTAEQAARAARLQISCRRS